MMTAAQLKWMQDVEDTMELWNGCSETLVGVTGDVNGMERRGDGSASACRAYEAFEAITVRTAARLLQLQQDGVVTERETWFYLGELADMDCHARRTDTFRLARLARRLLAKPWCEPANRGAATRKNSPACRDARPYCSGGSLAAA